ncbi:unnamed protein product [Boreogadus saida]
MGSEPEAKKSSAQRASLSSTSGPALQGRVLGFMAPLCFTSQDFTYYHMILKLRIAPASTLRVVNTTPHEGEASDCSPQTEPTLRGGHSVHFEGRELSPH